MKVKMTEYFQGTGVSAVTEDGTVVTVLNPSTVYDVGAVLGNWLIDNGKAVKYEDKPNVKKEEKLAEKLPELEVVEENPVMTSKKSKK